jgi:hypothetical protein
MAWFRRRQTNGLIFHSDRGRQTADGDFRKQRVTFRRKGDGRGTAVTKTLFGSLQVERLDEMRFATRRRAKDGMIDRFGVLQLPKAARDAGISEPDRLREKTPCRSRVQTHFNQK